MKVNLVKIGSKIGLKLPKAILEAYQIKDAVELNLKEGYIELRPVHKPRANWSNQLTKMAADPHEESVLPDLFEDEKL